MNRTSKTLRKKAGLLGPIIAGSAVLILGVFLFSSSGLTNGGHRKADAASAVKDHPAAQPASALPARLASLGKADGTARRRNSVGIMSVDPLFRKVMALRSRLGIGEDHLAAVADLLGQLREDRLSYERKIATVTRVSRYEVVVDIPTYHDAGVLFRKDFDKALADEVGPETAATFEKVLGRELSSENEWLGAAAQRIVITPYGGRLPPAPAGGDWLAFKHTVYTPKGVKVTLAMVDGKPVTFEGYRESDDSAPRNSLGEYALYRDDLPDPKS